MISNDVIDTGAGTVTPPAVGLCSAVQDVRMPGTAALWNATGLPVAGVRLRALASTDATRPYAPIADRREFAVAGAPTEHTSSTPGDLPPEDPPS
ncbi:hypothetical protein [Modestobacter versicolor]|uniref:hypothetical protein n=1 Tax=Modestobacter versicolor TaxID=429133 RepID=UPI0034DFB8BA